ncbi:MAG: RsiV family protein [Spirochaetaceae bacterium]|jgi:hypothetical protein|nr:RsiV family protein [Spirochaetaceae bacterium]
MMKHNTLRIFASVPVLTVILLCLSCTAVKKSAPQPASPAVETAAITENITWLVGRCDSTVASFLRRREWYSGGAHGNVQLESFAWDQGAKREITLDDLLPRTACRDLPALAAFARIELERTINPAGDQNMSAMIAQGTAATAENFSTFLVEETGGISIYFQAYQVAPWSFGTPKVTLPLVMP